MHNSSPITFIAWERANLAAVRDVLAGLQRDGIFLRRGHLLLETSWLGTGARDFYATAWRWDGLSDKMCVCYRRVAGLDVAFLDAD